MNVRAIGCAIATVVALLATTASGCGDHAPPAVDFGVSPGDVEATWLGRVGVGPAQTAAVCARGATDAIARALCSVPVPQVRGLVDLYRTLRLSPGSDGLVAVATHSLGLSARTVSALNPRTFVFNRYSPTLDDGIAVVAFSRGEPFVELAALDPATNAFNFYLLAFVPACGSRCAPRDLLTDRLEDGWTAWTLYAERDLEDTPLDCTSCHRADGAGTSGRLLMRQFDGPWMHWGDFRGVTPPTPCTDAQGTATQVEGDIPADGADLLRAVDGPQGQHGGVAVPALVAAPSGYDLSSFLFYVGGYADGVGDVPCLPPDCPFSEPHPFPSHDVLCDRLQHGRADRPGGAWDLHRQQLATRGLPVPYFDPDLLDPSLRAAIAADFTDFVDAPPAGHDAGDAFTRLSSLIGADVARAIGFLPDEADSAAVLLTKMCVRCHGEATDPHLARSRFNAAALDRLDAAGARKILERIALPATSPERMPPLRAGELPGWAQDRIADFLRPLADAAASGE